ncbi:hypothetical protein T492DRAFT_600546, partial [Pavlovales sp. CCMP2436]
YMHMYICICTYIYMCIYCTYTYTYLFIYVYACVARTECWRESGEAPLPNGMECCLFSEGADSLRGGEERTVRIIFCRIILFEGYKKRSGRIRSDPSLLILTSTTLFVEGRSSW